MGKFWQHYLSNGVLFVVEAGQVTCRFLCRSVVEAILSLSDLRTTSDFFFSVSRKNHKFKVNSGN